MTHKIALIGAGAMGGSIGLRLLKTGNELNVFDLDSEKVAHLETKGAKGAKSAAEAARLSDYIVVSLNSARIIQAAIFGPKGVAEMAKPNTLIIDMSSIDPEATRDLAAQATQKNLRWVDSPLSGGAPKALSGELTLMAGGNENDVNEAREVLKTLASNFTHMGPSGAGQATKLINQVLCGLNFLAVAEATQLAIDAGIDAIKIPQALKGGRADSAILQEYMPRYIQKDYRRTGRIDNMVKDLNAAQDLARRTNTAMPLTAVCAEIHRLMTASGLGGEDQAALMEFFKGTKKDC